MIINNILIITSILSSVLQKSRAIVISRLTINIIGLCFLGIIHIINGTIFGKGLGVINGLFFVSSITNFFKSFIYLLSIIIISLTSFYPRKLNKINLNLEKEQYLDIINLYLKKEKEKEKPLDNTFINKELYENIIYNKKINEDIILNKKSEQYTILEYSLIILIVLTGVSFLMSTSDLVSLFICLELQSYGLYILCALYKNSELSVTAALIYFLLGALASSFVLLGSSYIYSNSGNFYLDGLQIITNIWGDNQSLFFTKWYNSNYISYSLLILSAGLLFKMSAAPFHIWSPDVYDNVPTIVTTFISLIPKISILIITLELLHYTTNSNYNWNNSLLLSSLLSLIIGTILGLTQTRIKRLLAYSTISHLGFILLGLSINSIESNQSFLFYLIQYTLSNLNAFIILLSLGYGLFFYTSDSIEFNSLQDKNNSPIQLTNQIKGYHYINPIMSMSFAITFFSFIGVPPLIGFFGKQMILSSALDKGYVFLVLIAILTSIIGAVYYLNIIRKIYFDKHEYKLIKWAQYKYNNIAISSHLSIIIAIITNLILLFILTPQEFLNLCNILTLIVYTSC